MSLSESILKKMDELIALGKEFPPRITNQDQRAKLYSWETSCLNLLEKTFGKESDYYKRMAYYCTRNVSSDLRAGYGVALLESARKDFEELPTSIQNPKTEGALDSIQFLKQLCSRFHIIARQLRQRYNNRPTLDVSDEYDVQDLIHALLRINFEDIRPEEWTPSYAGGSSRMDFLLNREGIVVETKKTRRNLGAKEISDQLIIDIDRYSHHPNCKMLFCFVYDPEGRIANPDGLERDLSKDHNQTIVSVFITPKGK